MGLGRDRAFLPSGRRPRASQAAFLGLFLLLSAIPGIGSSLAGENFDARYPATLDRSPTPIGFFCTTSPADVWSLRWFRFTDADRLAIELGPSTVAFGRTDTNVLWAAVFPQQPGAIHSSLAGDGEQAATIWLRFHPARVGTLFPEESVIGQGAAEFVPKAQRLAAWKTNGSWQADGDPMVPSLTATVVDIDTTQGVRRFYSSPPDGGGLEYVAAFERQALPASSPISEEKALAAFDTLWKAFDAEYAQFVLRPEVDWTRLRDSMRPRAAKAKNAYELAATLAELLAPLEDLHISVRCGPESLPVFRREQPLNASRSAIEKTFGKLQRTRGDLAWARTGDGLGYINLYRLRQRDLPATFDAVLEQLGDAWGLVLDLRFNGGGDELLGRAVAGRFLERAAVYSVSQYRSGPKHDQLGRRFERVVEPRGPWRYQAPVVVLIGRRTMSSAESLALMLAQSPVVITMGDNSAGSSGKPKPLTLAGNIVVMLPTWLDRLPDGTPLDRVGVAPRVRVRAAPEVFAGGRDPVLDAALDHLRKTPAELRKPGKRG